MVQKRPKRNGAVLEDPFQVLKARNVGLVTEASLPYQTGRRCRSVSEGQMLDHQSQWLSHVILPLGPFLGGSGAPGVDIVHEA